MLCRVFLLFDLRIIVRKRPTGHKGCGQQCSHKNCQQTLAYADIQFDTSLLQGLPRWMSDPTSPRLNGPRARSSPPRNPPGKHQPVHQLLRFLVERGILARIPSSAHDFPHAPAPRPAQPSMPITAELYHVSAQEHAALRTACELDFAEKAQLAFRPIFATLRSAPLPNRPL